MSHSLLRPTAILSGVFLLMLALPACDMAINETEDLGPLEVVDVDADAGTWQMIVLTSPDQITVPPPQDVDTDAYRAELNAIKTAQGKLTREQRRILEYWSGGGVLRWNQIMRELVARYNLPPAPRADGTYGAPDAENPFSDPQFPFANPPYASRAYACVTVAQYEALKAAWYWKYQYNRPAPAAVDSEIQELMPVSDMPSYPSEDAVIAGASIEMLKLLFPASVEQITKMAAEHRQAALLSGRATASDIAAGYALGKAVAAAVVARASADGMREAAGNPALWKAQADAAIARGEVAWVSQEVPPRPAMLANYAQVQAWSMTREEIVAERPGPPPSTSSEKMQEELREVRETVENLTREQLAIAQFWNDGVGTYTPPGHWNDIAAEYLHDARWSEVRQARALALLNMAMHDAGVVCWDAKFTYYNPRPYQLDPRIKTVIGLPNFPSYTSGHSTFSAAAAEVLSYLFPEGEDDFKAKRDEAAISRLYGGIHYRADIEAGLESGIKVGQYTLRAARQDGAD
ncbi:MAG TPA: phosphatase PAP2 family protein [Rhodothermales bacterium]